MSTITLNLEIPLTDDDRKVLSTLLGDAPVIEVPALKGEPEEAAPAPKKKAPAKKSAPAKKEPEKAAPEADDEPDEFASDEAVKESAPAPKKAPAKKAAPAKKDDAPAEGGDKRKTAIELGSIALGEGRADEVRAALEDLGASRVSQLKEDQLDDFIKALS